MRKLHSALLTGAAAVAIAAAGPALAQNSKTHVMTIDLPGGGVAQIEYTGNVAPRVSFSESPAPAAAFAPVSAFFGPDSPFAMIERISAEMDRQADVMFRQAATLASQAQPGGLTEAVLRNLPPGSSSYTFVSTIGGNGFCSRSVEITSQGNGAPPRVVTHSSGNCGPAGGSTGAVNLPNVVRPEGRPAPVWTSAPPDRLYPAPDQGSRPELIYTGAQSAKPYAGLVREIPTGQR